MTIQIVPSILSADFSRLGEAVRAAEQGGADSVQIDVMDGQFVPNITVGAPVIAALRPVTALPLDIHLMITEPGRFIGDFVAAGADIITVHVEACTHVHRVIQQIQAAGVRAGVALNPGTPAVMVHELLEDVDLVLVMTVNPGFGGQAFISTTLPKIRLLRGMLDERDRNEVPIQVDGGVSSETAPQVVAAGARSLVAGSAIYNRRESVAAAIAALREAASRGLPAI
ncbi:MAG: ribulose-phosphate 3-epimerase [Ardenticatenaceae bacterium]|nr:ribulose-phosphate 3-epimerase [Ardenticatenaceae bacterium]